MLSLEEKYFYFYLLPIRLRNLFSKGGKNLWLQIRVPCWTASWFNSQWHGWSWKLKTMQMNIRSASWQTCQIVFRELHFSNPISFTWLYKYYHLRTISFHTTYTPEINFYTIVFPTDFKHVESTHFHLLFFLAICISCQWHFLWFHLVCFHIMKTSLLRKIWGGKCEDEGLLRCGMPYWVRMKQNIRVQKTASKKVSWAFQKADIY